MDSAGARCDRESIDRSRPIDGRATRAYAATGNVVSWTDDDGNVALRSIVTEQRANWPRVYC